MPRRIRDRIPEEPGEWREALIRARIPARYQRATAESIKPRHLCQWVMGVCSDPVWLAEGRGFILVGPLETGKSSIAALLAMEALMRAEGVLWLAAREIPGVMFRDGPENTELRDQLEDADLLVIDDLGAEGFRVDRAGGAALEAAIRVLYDHDRSVIVTSNLGIPRLRAEYPEPLVSVLERITSAVVVENDQWRQERGG